MKAISFLPAATQMIYDMQLEHLLHGVTFECPGQARMQKDILVHCILEGQQLSSSEIDKIFSSYKAQGKSLYYVNEEKLQRIAPQVVFTQDVCEVCQIDTKCTTAVLEALPVMPAVVTLTPQSLQDVFDSALHIATALQAEEAGYTYLAALWNRINHVVDRLRQARALPRRVLLLEWMKPVYNCGHWIPHQIGLAGGIDMLSNPSGDSIVIPWEKIKKYNPEVLVIAPCGFDIERSKEELHILQSMEGWYELEAVKNGEVHLAHFELFTQPSASTLVSGIEILAALFHPKLFNVPPHLLQHYYSLYKPLIHGKA
jgi:iron complex transport system substrate-binding protein